MDRLRFLYWVFRVSSLFYDLQRIQKEKLVERERTKWKLRSVTKIVKKVRAVIDGHLMGKNL